MSGWPAAAEQGVAERVGHHVAVRVADQPLVVGHLDRAEHQRAAGPEAVGVGARADPHSHRIVAWAGSRREKRVIVS